MRTNYAPYPTATTITKRQMVAICKRCSIPMYHCSCFLKLANRKRVTSREFIRRLYICVNYKTALRAIAGKLAGPVWHLYDYLYPQRRAIRQAWEATDARIARQANGK